jgi:hypothetical protein
MGSRRRRRVLTMMKPIDSWRYDSGSPSLTFYLVFVPPAAHHSCCVLPDLFVRQAHSSTIVRLTSLFAHFPISHHVDFWLFLAKQDHPNRPTRFLDLLNRMWGESRTAAGHADRCNSFWVPNHVRVWKVIFDFPYSGAIINWYDEDFGIKE